MSKASVLLSTRLAVKSFPVPVGLRVIVVPFKVIAPEVLPNVTATEFAVPRDSVPDAAFTAAEAPKFKVVVEVIPKVADVVNVAKEEAVSVVVPDNVVVVLVKVVVDPNEIRVFAPESKMSLSPTKISAVPKVILPLVSL